MNADISSVNCHILIYEIITTIVVTTVLIINESYPRQTVV